MKSFKELETDYHHSLVTLVDSAEAASGSLSLDKRNTSVQLSSAEGLVHSRAPNGWFDLTLQAGPTTILLKKVVIQSVSTRSMGQSSGHVETMFPNVVLVDAQNLSKPGMVKAVRFQLEHLNYFFYHQLIERHSLHQAPPETLATLEKLRDDPDALQRGRKPREYDVFNPTELFMVHGLYQICEFSLGKASYNVGWGMTSRGPNLQGIDVQHNSTAEVVFDDPVEIDTALDAVWAWQRFLNELAFQELPLLAISFSDRTSPFSADVYIPNLVDPESGKGHLHPGDLPLTRYSDRDAFAACLKTWLEKEPERKEFRIGVNRVLEKMEQIVSLEQVIALCSALESLRELDRVSSVTDEQIDELAKGAEAVALEKGIDAPADRLRGLLALLKHTSLPKRMKLVAKALAQHIPIADSELVFDFARNLRTSGAHGSSSTEFEMQSMAPTISGMAALLVLFDLVSCGVPTDAIGQQKIIALRRAREAITWLRRETDQRKSKVSAAKEPPLTKLAEQFGDL